MSFCNINDYAEKPEYPDWLHHKSSRDKVRLRAKRLPLAETFILFGDFFISSGQDASLPPNIDTLLRHWIAKIETDCGRSLGDPDNPLLLTVSTGLCGSVSGFGVSAETLPALIERYGKIKAFNHTIQFLMEFSTIVLEAAHIEEFSSVDFTHLHHTNSFLGVMSEEEFSQGVDIFCRRIEEQTGTSFPVDPAVQLTLTLRKMMLEIQHNFAEDIIIQEVVLPLQTPAGIEGVFYTRNPYTGRKDIYGVAQYTNGEKFTLLQNSAQGTSANSGSASPAAALLPYQDILERYYKDIVEVNFVTGPQGTPVITGIHEAQKSSRAAVYSYLEMAALGVMTPAEAITKIDAHDIETLCHDAVSKESKANLEVFTDAGTPGAPGSATGILFIGPQAVHDYLQKNDPAENDVGIILAVDDLMLDDHWVIDRVCALVTRSSGMSSHGAVMARSKGIPCILGLTDMQIDLKKKRLAYKDLTVRQGEHVTVEVLDRATLYRGKAAIESVSDDDTLFAAFRNFLHQFQQDEKIPFKVMVNINNSRDAKKGLQFGADGVGLCRTENYFISTDRLTLMQEILFAGGPDSAAMQNNCAALYNLQVKDYHELFTVMEHRPVVIRLMDYPLHEVLPGNDQEISAFQKNHPSLSESYIRETVQAHLENNPIFGLRACRFGLIYEDIYNMQISALLAAAYQFSSEGGRPDLSILIPLIMNENEFTILKERITELDACLRDHLGVDADRRISLRIGAMIELPSAALAADKLAVHADFFSFGTNDLTQATYGISRNDGGRFLPVYLQRGILPADPFSQLGEAVKDLIKITVERGSRVNPNLTFTICGEQGGDAKSLSFVMENGLSRVSVSPYRIMLTRLAYLKKYIAEYRQPQPHGEGSANTSPLCRTKQAHFIPVLEQ